MSADVTRLLARYFKQRVFGLRCWGVEYGREGERSARDLIMHGEICRGAQDARFSLEGALGRGVF